MRLGDLFSPENIRRKPRAILAEQFAPFQCTRLPFAAGRSWNRASLVPREKFRPNEAKVEHSSTTVMEKPVGILFFRIRKYTIASRTTVCT